MEKRVIGVSEKLPFLKCLPLSIQHVFAMFGATVLVPTLFNIDPGIVLFMNGLGTLLFLIITKGKSPAYLGSSFAFLAIGQSVIATYGYQTACGAFIVTGLVGCLIALCIKFLFIKSCPESLFSIYFSPHNNIINIIYGLHNTFAAVNMFVSVTKFKRFKNSGRSA